jgi:hypothetical protein
MLPFSLKIFPHIKDDQTYKNADKILKLSGGTVLLSLKIQYTKL